MKSPFVERVAAISGCNHCTICDRRQDCVVAIDGVIRMLARKAFGQKRRGYLKSFFWLKDNLRSIVGEELEQIKQPLESVVQFCACGHCDLLHVVGTIGEALSLNIGLPGDHVFTDTMQRRLSVVR